MLKKGIKQLLEEANAEIETISAEEARELKEKGAATFIDIRDIRELWRDGKIPGAEHMPRGMLEFWADPDSPYYKEVFSEEKKLVFY